MPGASEGSPAAAAPAPCGGRVESLDVARGLALLGILLVNVEYFFRPLGAVIAPAAPEERGVSLLLWWLVETLCEGKLYPLFSLLFGVGLTLQRRRLEVAGVAFAPFAVRRLGFLAVLGLIHGVLLWYGDILFAYGVVGLALVAFGGASARALLTGGGVVLALAVLVGSFLGALEASTPNPSSSEMPAIDDAPAEVLLQQLRSSAPGGPADPYWQAAETVAYRQGPWLQAEVFRVASYALLILALAAGGGLEILAMFLLGAGLAKALALDRGGDGAEWLPRLAVAGLAAGLPLALLATWLGGYGSGAGALAVAAAARAASGAALAIGYLGCAHLLVVVAHGAVPIRGPLRLLGAAGRTALTHYLMQTVIATAIAYHWGLARFGTLGRPARVALALAVFAGLSLAGSLWLSRRRFGPLEQAWRRFSYGRPRDESSREGPTSAG
ncbi:MAG TPA: DUF418 domain-containing protein [Thermoanaerobaculia bacterium]|nr:DUF418 domain-containing protein [Thermoanaerobaculia bacterium]